ncbi:MAG: dNTP triphosphohydrolase [Alphaproteobacteria bacterium]|nr:dNTP triphosphohydrolase [Alphaproteobacteria bacterium]
MAPDERLYPESVDRFRTPYQRDRDRIIHSRYFRCLKHKTQVFVAPQNDYYRTRLTHTIEVAQIARTLAVIFEVDENLTEALALAHDLGHPPFGHSGEQALDEILRDDGDNNGFDHNIQTLRILTLLEKRNPDYQGLNPTKALLEGTLKHSFPLKKINGKFRDYEIKLAQIYQIDLTAEPMPEAQIAGIADDIAYNHHDMDDGLRAGIFDEQQMQQALPFIAKDWQEIKKRTDDVSLRYHMLVGRLINAAVSDLADGKNSATKVIAFSEQMQNKQKMQKKFLSENMYQHPNIAHKNQEGQKMLKFLFKHFMAKPEKLPDLWRDKFDARGSARVIADYIASMGDAALVKMVKTLQDETGLANV